MRRMLANAERDTVLRLVAKLNARAAELDRKASGFDVQHYMALAAQLREVANEFEKEWKEGRPRVQPLPASAQLTVDQAPPEELLDAIC